MLTDFSAWWNGFVEHWRRQSFVDGLQRLTDRQLDDMGLRRDQLDTLRLPPATKGPPRRAVAPAVRPSLQGCG